MILILHYLLAIASVPTILLLTRGSDVDARQFVIDFDTDVVNRFYPRRQSEKQRMLKNGVRDIDVAANRKICESILAITFNTDKGDGTAFSPPPDKWNYRPKIITVVNGIGGAGFYVEVFLCSALDDSHYLRKLYVSRQYNLNANGDMDTSEEYVAGRFIFRNSGFFGLVELPGKNFVSPEHDVERLYLERREETDLPKKMGFDDLCQEDKNEQRRICTAVFASEYFEDRILSLGPSAVRTECQLEVVSFQTNYGTNKAAERLYREWMLPCNVKEDENLDYLLSHAYRSNQIFVYSRDAKKRAVFVKNLFVDVRIRVDSHRKKNATPNDTVFFDDHEF